MRANSYPGRCHKCNANVPAEAGYIQQVNGRWRPLCAECAPAQAAPRREITETGEVHMPFDRDALPLLRAMPGARWNPNKKCWAASVESQDLARTIEIATKLGLEVPKKLRASMCSVRASVAQDLPSFLFPFQRDGVVWLRTHDRALLGDDMGLGKTVQSLVALPEKAQAIVICPASLKVNWADEVRKWRTDLSPVVLSGRGSFRLPAVGEVIIVNFDILPAESKIHTKVGKWDHEPTALGKGLAKCTVIVDEATAVKNFKAKRTKAVRALAKHAQRVWLLTGTPLLGKPFDLWGVLGCGEMDRVVFGGFKGFLRCMAGSPGHWGGYEFGKPLPEVPERLRRVMIRRLKDDVLPDLPPKRYRDLSVAIELDATMEAAFDEYGDMIECGSLPPFEAFSAVRAEIARQKVPAMLEQVESYEEAGEPLVVFSAHRAPIDELAKRDGWEVITGDQSSEKRAATVAAFQAGRLKGVGLTIRAGGYGLTLTRASHCLFVDREWTPAANRQAEDRIRRIGQEASSLLYTCLVSDHAMDRRVDALIREKEALIDVAVEAEVDYAPKAAQGKDHAKKVAEAKARRLAAEKQAAAERKAAAELQAKIDAERARVGQQRTLARFLPDADEHVDHAWVDASLSFLISVCDGAETKDGQGFNKVDAWYGRHLSDLVATGSEDAYRAASALLRKYSRQLKAAGLAKPRAKIAAA